MCSLALLGFSFKVILFCYSLVSSAHIVVGNDTSRFPRIRGARKAFSLDDRNVSLDLGAQTISNLCGDGILTYIVVVVSGDLS